MAACLAVRSPSIYRLPNGFQWEREKHPSSWATSKLISASGMSGILKDLYYEWN